MDVCNHLGSATLLKWQAKMHVVVRQSCPNPALRGVLWVDKWQAQLHMDRKDAMKVTAEPRKMLRDA
jgi:hypothetical protein